ncbi:MAG: 4-hydroxy-3-methylbut-2-enyl diphosphate reductase [Chlamydiota bacterium]
MKQEIELLLISPRGFCAGVVRAIDTVKRSLELWGPPIYVKHQIVHNSHVVAELAAKGAIFIDDVEDVPPGSRLIYSAHGVSPAIRALAKKRKLIEIDATCGLVTKVHSAVKRFASKGYQIVLIGHRRHVEVIGTAGEAPAATTVVESVTDVEKLSFCPNQQLFYTTQTTLSLDDVKEVVAALKVKYPEIKTLPSSSICYATTNRQLALKQVAKRADLVLVVGDQTSSNSNRLCEVARGQGVPAYLINNPAEINPNWLKPIRVLALTAGASTPESVVQRCIARLCQLGASQPEEVVCREENVFFKLPREVLVER